MHQSHNRMTSNNNVLLSTPSRYSHNPYNFNALEDVDRYPSSGPGSPYSCSIQPAAGYRCGSGSGSQISSPRCHEFACISPAGISASSVSTESLDFPPPRIYSVPQDDSVFSSQRDSSASSHVDPSEPAPAVDLDATTSSTSEPVDANGAWHTALTGKCEFFRFPADLAEGETQWPADCPSMEDDGDAPRAFVGQARVQNTPEGIALLAEHLIGTAPTFVYRHSVPWCFVLHFATTTQRDAFISFTQALFFDFGGVWIAQDADARVAMKAQITQVTTPGPVQQAFPKTLLPRRAAILEAFTTTKRTAPKTRREGGKAQSNRRRRTKA